METANNNQDRSRLVVDIPDDLHHRIRVKAAMERRHMRDLVSECLESCFPSDVIREPRAPYGEG